MKNYNNFYYIWKKYLLLEQNVDAAQQAVKDAQLKQAKITDYAETLVQSAQGELQRAEAELQAAKKQEELEKQQKKATAAAAPVNTGTAGTMPLKTEEGMPGNAAGDPAEGAMGKNAVPHQSQDYRDRPNMDDEIGRAHV